MIIIFLRKESFGGYPILNDRIAAELEIVHNKKLIKRSQCHNYEE